MRRFVAFLFIALFAFSLVFQPSVSTQASADPGVSAVVQVDAQPALAVPDVGMAAQPVNVNDAALFSFTYATADHALQRPEAMNEPASETAMTATTATVLGEGSAPPLVL